MPSFPLNARLSQPSHYRRVFDGPNVKVSSKAFLLLAVENSNGGLSGWHHCGEKNISAWPRGETVLSESLGSSLGSHRMRTLNGLGCVS